MVASVIVIVAAITVVASIATGVMAYVVRNRDVHRDQVAEAVREQEMERTVTVGRHVGRQIGIPEPRGVTDVEYEQPEPRHRRS